MMNARAILDAARALGLELAELPEIVAATTAADRADELNAQFRAMFGGTVDRREIESRLVDGTITPFDLLVVAVTGPDMSPRQNASRFFEGAAKLAAADAIEHLAQIGDRWVTELLRPVVDAALADLPALANTIGPGWSDSTISRADRETRAAFKKASAVRDRLDTLLVYADELTDAGVLSHRVAQLRHPAKANVVQSEPVWSLIEAHRRGAGVGLWLDSETQASIVAA